MTPCVPTDEGDVHPQSPLQPTVVLFIASVSAAVLHSGSCANSTWHNDITRTTLTPRQSVILDYSKPQAYILHIHDTPEAQITPHAVFYYHNTE